MKSFIVNVVLIAAFARTVAGSEFRVVLDFADAPGAIPTGGLLFHESRLYGTTSYGGQVGWGTIFSVDAQGGDFRLLYSMADPQPGNSQVSNLVLSGNKLFGTTFGGGQGEQGTVFSFDLKGGSFKTLRRFNAEDGMGLESGLAVFNGRLFGTAAGRYQQHDGNVFSLNEDGSDFRILHTFGPSWIDGVFPAGSLSFADGKLIGVTRSGGQVGGSGNGTVFSVNPDGTGYEIIHNFGVGPSNSGLPLAGVTISGTRLYGTTTSGGNFESGLIYSMNLDGTDYQTVYNFRPEDGQPRFEDLLAIGSQLFGVTQALPGDRSKIFTINADGTGFTVLHEFRDFATDGLAPVGKLTTDGTWLYGATALGGRANLGVVFAVAIPDPSCLALAGVGSVTAVLLVLLCRQTE